MKATLSQRLVYLRKERGYTQKQAAAKLNISQALLSHYEKGIRECGLEFLCNCAQLYDVSTDYLLGRSCEKHKIQKQGTNSACQEVEDGVQKQILLSALGMLYDLYDQVGHEELMDKFSLYVSITIYMLTRGMYEAGDNIPGFFALPNACYPYSPKSQRVLCEMSIKNILSGETWPTSKHICAAKDAIPKIDHTALSEGYPNDYSALLRALHIVDMQCSKKKDNRG